MICSLKNDRKGNPPLPEIWASWPNKNRYVLLNKHSLQKYIGEQLEATVCTANQHWWGFTVLKQSSYYNTRLCCIKRNSIMYKVEALWKQRAHTTNGNIHTHTPTPPPTRTPPHTRTHTHKKKHTHTQSFYSVLNCDEGWMFLGLFSCSTRVHAEQLDAMWVPIEANTRVEDQRPNIWDEEVFWLVFLHVLKL